MEKRHRSKPLKMAPYLISSADIKDMIFMLLIRCYQVYSKSLQKPSGTFDTNSSCPLSKAYAEICYSYNKFHTFADNVLVRSSFIP